MGHSRRLHPPPITHTAGGTTAGGAKWRSSSLSAMSSYAHKVNDPTATIASLQEQIATLQSLVESTFKKPMAECLAELEGTDASARAADAQAALQGRLTGAKLLVSAAYVYLDVIWSTWID